MIYGTSHFYDNQSAIDYYKPYEDNPKQSVKQKLTSGEIHIGKPVAKPNQEIFLDHREMRYFIMEHITKHTKLPNKTRL
jgi:hypothetical protein